MQALKRHFITGLIVIIPLFLTVYLFIFIFKFFDGILGGFINSFIKDKLGFYIPGLGLILSVFIILFTGIIASRLIGKKIFAIFEKWYAGLPLIKNIYPAFKQLVVFLLAQKETGFKRVVLVEYPSKGIWSVGFLTNEGMEKINNACGRDMVGVFLILSPGPFSGYVVFVPREELKFPDISVSDALKIIISGGVIK
ncbi:MAG: DUF502 domain-containing protein [Candidatus Omnitrophota bacterium]